MIREERVRRAMEPPGVATRMSTQTLLLLAVIAVLAGYAAFASPALGGAIAVAAAVVGILYVIIKDDQRGGGTGG